jgi:homoserine O-acetyltransferase/O-succinyltransferase
MTGPTTLHHFHAGDVVLQSGRTFPGMQVAYTTYGQLAADKSNVIVYPTSYSAQHTDTEWLVRDGGILDTSRFFVIIPNLFGNGLSSSPSNTPWPLTGDRYPHVTYHDAVRVQQRLLAEVFGVETVQLVYGWSMGAMQAYHWASAFGERVQRIAVICGSARCAPHNAVFLDAVHAALTADPAWQDGVFREKPVRGFRAMGRLYASMALSQDFYRDELWRALRFSSLEDFLVRQWEASFSRRDPSDLLAQLWTWRHGDISDDPRYRGDLAAALRAISARVLLMPGTHDMYFRVDDNARELEHLQHGTLIPIPSVWGHRAGNPAQAPADADFIRSAVHALLAD